MVSKPSTRLSTVVELGLFCLTQNQRVKLLIWQSCFDDGPRPSQRALAGQLGVSQPYVCKVMRKTHPDGWDALTKDGNITFEELERARSVTAGMRERAPDLFAPAPQPKPSKGPRVMTVDQAIAETWREVDEWKRNNPHFSGGPRTVEEWQELERRGRSRAVQRAGALPDKVASCQSKPTARILQTLS